jgi:multidrug transporter EmrE-like cation transporter
VSEKIIRNKIVWGLLFTAGLIDTLSVLVIKIRLNSLKEIDFNTIGEFFDFCIRFFESPYAVFAVIMLLSSPLLSFIALSRIQISTAYPVLAGFHLFLIESFSHIVLREQPSMNKILGVCCIFVSLFLFYKDREWH